MRYFEINNGKYRKYSSFCFFKRAKPEIPFFRSMRAQAIFNYKYWRYLSESQPRKRQSP